VTDVPTPAKFMKKPDPADLEGASADQLHNLAVGLARRICKLELENPTGDQRGEHILSLLRASAALAKHDLHLSCSLINYLQSENQVEGFVAALVDVATNSRDDEQVSEFLVALKSNINTVGQEEREAFMAAVEEKKTRVWSS